MAMIPGKDLFNSTQTNVLLVYEISKTVEMNSEIKIFEPPFEVCTWTRIKIFETLSNVAVLRNDTLCNREYPRDKKWKAIIKYAHFLTVTLIENKNVTELGLRHIEH